MERGVGKGAPMHEKSRNMKKSTNKIGQLCPPERPSNQIRRATPTFVLAILLLQPEIKENVGGIWREERGAYILCTHTHTPPGYHPLSISFKDFIYQG